MAPEKEVSRGSKGALFNTTVTEIKSDKKGVCSVSLKETQTGDQKELGTEGVSIFVGFSPNTQLIPAGIKVNAGGYVLTNEKCETNIPWIFAVGDFQQKYATRIVIAATHGRTAALGAAHFVEMKKASTVCSGMMSDE